MDEVGAVFSYSKYLMQNPNTFPPVGRLLPVLGLILIIYCCSATTRITTTRIVRRLTYKRTYVLVKHSFTAALLCNHVAALNLNPSLI